jgi:hypothetical protein
MAYPSQQVQRTLHSPAVQDVRVDHRRLDAAVTQQLLHRADVVSVRQEVGGKRVSQRMAGRRLGQCGLLDRSPERPLDRLLRQMMPALRTGAWRVSRAAAEKAGPSAPSLSCRRGRQRSQGKKAAWPFRWTRALGGRSGYLLCPSSSADRRQPFRGTSEAFSARSGPH